MRIEYKEYNDVLSPHPDFGSMFVMATYRKEDDWSFVGFGKTKEEARDDLIELLKENGEEVPD